VRTGSRGFGPRRRDGARAASSGGAYAGPTAGPQKLLSRFINGWHSRLTLALFVYVVFVTAAFSVRKDGPDQDFFRDLATVPISPAVALLAFGASAAPGLDPRSRAAWRRLGAARIAYAAGDVFWFLDTALGRGHAPLSVASLSYLIYNPTLLWALLSFPNVLRSRREKAQFWLDAAIGFLGGAMLWYFALVRLREGTAFASGAATLSTAFLVLDLLLVLGISVTLQRRTDPRNRPVFLVLGCGMMFALAGDLMQGHFAIEGTQDRGGPDALFMINTALVGLSAHLQVLRAREKARGFGEGLAPVPVAFNFLPYASAAFGYAILLLAVFRERWSAVGGLTLLAVALTTVVVLRQVVTVRENMALLAEQAARQSEARFRALVQNSSDVILLVDADTVVRYQTPSAERVLGYAADALVGRRLAAIVHGDDIPKFSGLIAQALGSAGVTGPGEVRLHRDDGSWLFVEITVTNLVDNTELSGLVLTVRDVHERKMLEERLSYQAFHDPLTGLANRALLTNRLSHALASARREVRTVALLLLDLDHFKTVNDSLGHAAGDQVLIEVSRRLESCVRLSDTAARLGGDEFAVLLQDTEGETMALDVASRITRALRLPFSTEGQEVFLGASIGVAITSEPRDSAGDLIRNADVAMYTVKQQGRGRVAVFEPGMLATAVDRIELEADLRHAVERKELAVFFQPILRLEDEAVVGAEALLRWRHPRRGLLYPGEFLPLAEDNELIASIGAWVLEESCRRAVGWGASTPDGRPLVVSVNLAGRQLRDPRFRDEVAAVLRETGLPAERLVLEVTESLPLLETGVVVETLRELRSLGVRIAIDDFGSGYSSLSYLQHLPVDMIKLHQSFVDGLEARGHASPLLRGIVDLGRAMGLSVIAEGIETSFQASVLRECGCELAQGFLFGQGMEPEVFAEALQRGSEWASRTARPG
jgi:diguanylate cyclase (GGDEF)-like protein/PAS domain S-box-containing protein